MSAWLWLVPAAAGLYGLHRLARWAEDRGWIHYTRSHGGGGVMAGIVQDLQTHLHPRIEHVRRAAQRPQEDDRQDPGAGRPDGRAG